MSDDNQIKLTPVGDLEAAGIYRRAAVRDSIEILCGKSYPSFQSGVRRDIALHVMLRSVHRQARLNGIATIYDDFR